MSAAGVYSVTSFARREWASDPCRLLLYAAAGKGGDGIEHRASRARAAEKPRARRRLMVREDGDEHIHRGELLRSAGAGGPHRESNSTGGPPANR